MIASRARAAAPPRAARITVLVLGAALARASVAPAGEGLAAAVFAALLIGILAIEGVGARPGDRPWPLKRSILSGLGVAAVLAAPVLWSASAGPAWPPIPVHGAFLPWAAAVALVASLEEATIRGTLQQAWRAEAGPVPAILCGALVFAAIHLPRYGLSVMPLDLAVGLALGGLRELTGRVLPCAIAHTAADWAAWLSA
ncbi:MAG TPA: CPBP family intramembrane glutamic endopeptidase [Candidatus Limnocylindrales bacterium]|nr:CPBP family intramembrane glutamic endopeptidase [Candidatus Limnocylindrales bacterium]